MNYLALTAILAIGWVAATGGFTLNNLVFGALIATVALALIRGRVKGRGLARRTWRITTLAGLFLIELFASAFRVAVLVMSPNIGRQLRPAIIAFPLRLEHDAQITLLANMITLTPGTLSVDVSDDRKFLYVHAIAAPNRDELIESIAAGFEKRILEAFG